MATKHEDAEAGDTSEAGEDIAIDAVTAAAADTEAAPSADHTQHPKGSQPGPGTAAGTDRRLWSWVTTHKKISIPVIIVAVLALLAAVPYTRYVLAGMVVRSDFTVVVTDSQTNKPVSSATVTIEGKTAHTDGVGKAKLHVNVGNAHLNLDKKYYKAKSVGVLVGFTQKQPYAVHLEATGRPVPVKVVNKISGRAVAGITIAAGDTQAITDTKGEATVVVPADKPTLTATLSGNGYNKVDTTIVVTAGVVPANTLTVTPAGKLYFLSDASGKLDVMKSDLDGQHREVVLPGTGKEDRGNTVLLASRDWKYVALLSKRDGGDYAKLFLIETDGDKLTTMDEGEATFGPLGWSGDRLIYTVNRAKLQLWDAKRQALKSYSASSKSITVLDQTVGQGNDYSNYKNDTIGDAYIFDKEVVYVKSEQSSGSFYGPVSATLNSIQADGSQKKTVKTYTSVYNGYISLQDHVGDLNELYLLYSTDANNHSKVDSYEDGKITTTDLTADQYYNDPYSTYIVSPSGDHTFWTEYRDGKNVFFVGDKDGKNGKQWPGISSEDYVAYGWYTDEYVLVTKKSSELYIAPIDGQPKGIDSMFKVGDYFKPNYLLRGYGYGYGG
jgi:hypothetical protein